MTLIRVATKGLDVNRLEYDRSFHTFGTFYTFSYILYLVRFSYNLVDIFTISKPSQDRLWLLFKLQS